MARPDEPRPAGQEADLGPWAAACLALLTAVTWVIFALMLRGAMKHWPVGTGGFFSRILSLAVLAVFVCARRGGVARLRGHRSTRWLVAMGLVAIAISYLMFGALKKNTTATHLALLTRLDLVFALLIGTVLGLQRLTLADWLVAGFMLGGAAMVAEVHTFTWSAPATGGKAVSDPIVGDAMIVGVALGLAVNAFIIRRIMRRANEDVVAFYNMCFSLTGFLILATYYKFPLPTTGLDRPGPWLWLCGLGVFAGLSIRLYYHALRRMAVWRLRALLLISPVLSAIAEWAIWGDRPSGLQCAGMVVILAGAGVLIRRPLRAEAVVAAEEDHRPTNST